MKRQLAIAGVLALIAFMAALFYLNVKEPPTGRVDSEELVKATRSYAADLRAKGLPVPAEVSLQELIRKGLLSEADVSGFSGMKVTVGLTADESHPQDVLVRARLPDGHEIVALGDGSVQQR